MQAYNKIEKVKRFSIYSVPSLYTASPTFCATVICFFQSMNLHHYHPKYIVYIRVHPWCCTFYRFRQMHNVMYMSLWYPTEHIFNVLKPSVLHPFIPSYFLFPGHHFSFDCIVLPFLEHHVFGISHIM